MAIHFISTLVVVVGFAIITGVIAAGHDRSMRPLLWIALAEYILCAGAQIAYGHSVNGGDSFYYCDFGEIIVRFMDANLDWAGPEVFKMLMQRESALDRLVESPQSNTGSMYASAAFILYLVRSRYAAHVLIAGFSFLSALGIFSACRQADPAVNPRRLFVATVLFPSIAFWTSALHKEAFCLIGMGLLLSAWRAVYARQLFRVCLYAPLGLVIILLFRPPALPPIMLGFVAYLVVERLQKARGPDAAVVGPLYLGLGLALFAAVMVAVTTWMPSLSLEQLGETMVKRQQQWAHQSTAGGSAVDLTAEDAQPTGFGPQLLRAPLALLNALFRPQLFDVHNVPTLVGALEMTTLTVMIIRLGVHHGLRGLVTAIQRSPFLLMCTVITIVGGTFVGLATLNLGSLARYRVPFLPFYGALIIALTQGMITAKAAAKAAARAQKATGRRRPTRSMPRPI